MGNFQLTKRSFTVNKDFEQTNSRNMANNDDPLGLPMDMEGRPFNS